MIIKTLTALEKRMENINEALNKEIKKNKSEMKNMISEIKHTPDGINSRLEEAEEPINDLEDRVMEGNQAEQIRGKKYAK